MGLLKIKLKGASIIEAVIASMIFLVVFVISLSTVTGFTLREDEGYVLLEAERRLTDCFNRYGDGTWSGNTYEENYEWGEIIINISNYKDYGRIQEIILRAKLKNSRKTIEYRRLIVRCDE